MWNAVLNARASRVGEASSVVDASASVTDSNRCASRYARRASATSRRSPPSAGRPSWTTFGGSTDTIERPAPPGRRSRSYRIDPSSTMKSVHVSCVCGGYGWLRRAWSTSRIPGTGGRHALTSTAGDAIAGSYKTVDDGRPSVVLVEELIGLVVFSFVSAGTPGPNNILLWASGATFGLRRTLPHIAGTALGIGAMTLTVAGGFGFVITSLPALAIAMKLAG